MGKNLKSIMCKECKEEVCYYGSTICPDCKIEQAEIEFEEYQTARVEGFIPADMTFEEWLVNENEREDT